MKKYRRIICLFLLAYLGFSVWVLFSLAVPSTMRGIEELQAGKKLLLSNPAQAAPYFQASSQDFQVTSAQLQSAPFLVKLLTPLPPFRWQVDLLKASSALSSAGSQVSALASSFPKINLEDSTDISKLLSRTSDEFLAWQVGKQTEIANLEDQLAIADDQLRSIPSWIMFSQRDQIEQLQTQVTSAHQGLRTLRQTLIALRPSLGSQDPNPHTFLVLFQNNAELRPTGGFLGSYALLKASSGSIRGFQFGPNVYKIDKRFLDAGTLPSFEPLRTVTFYSGFRDSNVGFGFLNEAAKNMQATYQKATDSRLDGMIFVDTSIVESLLRQTGPLPLPGLAKTINADTFRRILAQEIERDYYERPGNKTTDEPKQVLADLIPVLLQHLSKTPGLAPKLFPILGDAVNRKSLQFWSNDPSLEHLAMTHLPLDTPVAGNWLKIVNNNLGGGKSSLSVKQTAQIEQHLDLLHHQLINRLTVTRQHLGTNQWPDGDNRNYMEIYLPAAATPVGLPQGIGGETTLVPDQQVQAGLIGKQWQTAVDSTSQWKKVGFWATTKVGETTSFILTYTLPLTEPLQHQFTYLKQAGSAHEQLSAFGFEGEVNSNLFLRP